MLPPEELEKALEVGSGDSTSLIYVEECARRVSELAEQQRSSSSSSSSSRTAATGAP